MSEQLTSIRIRTSLHDQLRLLAADLSRERQVRITMRSLLEEGVRGLFQQPLAQWVHWASQGIAPVSVGETSVSVRIRAELVRDLGVLAAHMTTQSRVPITKVHLLEEAGRRILAQVQEERDELDALV